MTTSHLPCKFHADQCSRFLVILLTKKEKNKERNKLTKKVVENNTVSPILYRGLGNYSITRSSAADSAGAVVVGGGGGGGGGVSETVSDATPLAADCSSGTAPSGEVVTTSAVSRSPFLLQCNTTATCLTAI